MISDFTIGSWTHGKMTASDKLIYGYIYDHLKHNNVTSVIIPSEELATVGEVTPNAACAIGRKLEQMGLIERKNVRRVVNGKGRKGIEYSLPHIDYNAVVATEEFHENPNITVEQAEDVERASVESAIERNNGDLDAAAKELGVSTRTVRRLVERYLTADEQSVEEANEDNQVTQEE